MPENNISENIKNVSVDKAISNIARSAAKLKISNLIQFDPIADCKSLTSPIFARSIISDNPFVSPATTANNSGTISSTGTESSSGRTLIPSIDFSFPIPTFQTKFTSVSDKVEEVILQNLQALAIGAALGAAVAAGLGIGLVTASGIISSFKYFPSYCRKIYLSSLRFVFGSRKNSWVVKNQDSGGEVVGNGEDIESKLGISFVSANPREDDRTMGQSSGEDVRTLSTESEGASEEITKISFLERNDKHRIAIIRGDVRSNHTMQVAAIDQCRECLDCISAVLSKHMFIWQHVKRINAFVAVDRCDGDTFRSVLSEYPINRHNTIVSIYYVQRLEQASACVQIEALASA